MKSLLSSLWSQGLKSGFLTLVAGTGVAQVIPIALAPILTRIYTPADFGVVALYLSIAGILGVCATLRYELAIMQPEKDEEAALLVVASVLIGSVISAITLLVITIFGGEIARLLGAESLGVWLYLLPLSVFFAAIYQSMNYWLVRQSCFSSVAIANTMQGTSTPVSQIGLSSLQTSGGGNMISGTLIGQGVASIYMLLKGKFWGENSVLSMAKSERGKGKAVILEYKNLPRYALPGTLVDTLAVNIPVIVLGRLFEQAIVGWFSLVFRVLSIPARLVSTALSQLYLKNFSEVAGANATEIKSSVKSIQKSALVLGLTMVPMILLMYLWGEQIFAFVFGVDWAEAGRMAGLLVFAVAIRFVVSPLSSILALKQHAKKAFYWQLLYLISMLMVFYLTKEMEVFDVLLFFVLNELALYFLYFLVILYAAKQLDKEANTECVV